MRSTRLAGAPSTPGTLSTQSAPGTPSIIGTPGLIGTPGTPSTLGTQGHQVHQVHLVHRVHQVHLVHQVLQSTKYTRCTKFARAPRLINWIQCTRFAILCKGDWGSHLERGTYYYYEANSLQFSLGPVGKLAQPPETCDKYKIIKFEAFNHCFILINPPFGYNYLNFLHLSVCLNMFKVHSLWGFCGLLWKFKGICGDMSSLSGDPWVIISTNYVAAQDWYFAFCHTNVLQIFWISVTMIMKCWMLLQ